MAVLSYLFLCLTLVFLNTHVINCAIAISTKGNYSGFYFVPFVGFLLVAIFCGVSFGYTF